MMTIQVVIEFSVLAVKSNASSSFSVFDPIPHLFQTFQHLEHSIVTKISLVTWFSHLLPGRRR